MGTPEAMYREDGEAVWTCELNSYGKVRDYKGESKTMCPFRYQGQYEDAETGLYYNRFRYYSPEEGMYLSQDPIGLNGGITLYNYVHDPNSWIDTYGFSGCEEGRAGCKIADENGVQIISHGSNDRHKPAHVHVIGGGKETRIGANGKPLKNQPELTTKQKAVVVNHKKEIRKEVNKVGKANQRIYGSHKSNI
jgi:RHS repeat-associated protein